MLDYKLRHEVALLDPYKSIVKVFDGEENKYLVGIKNVASIPNTLMKKLEKTGFCLHTIDKKSQLAGRAVDTQLINPISGRIMSGSSSGSAINVFAGINDLGIGTDGGGSVLAPAISVNIIGFISKLIEQDSQTISKLNTDGISATNSIGFMARDKKILFKAIKDSINIEASIDYGIVLSDKQYDNVDSTIIEVMDCHSERNVLTPYLKEVLSKCDCFIVSEGPIDINGFGDSLFGHFDETTKRIQQAANKGYVRVANIAGATAICLPQKGLGMATLIMCESIPDKISKLLRLASIVEDVKDPLIERYFLDHHNYFIEGYKI